MEFLSLGSIVHLKGDSEKVNLMIITYLPQTEENGVKGYYDYAACLYPLGLAEDKAYFFNDEDIDEVVEKGYLDKTGQEFINALNGSYETIKLPKFKHIDKSYGKDGEDLSDLLED